MKLGAGSCGIQSWELGPRAGQSPSHGPTVQGKAGQTWAGAAHTGPFSLPTPCPPHPVGPDVQFDVTIYRPILSLPTALPLTVILLAPEVGGGRVGL